MRPPRILPALMLAALAVPALAGSGSKGDGGDSLHGRDRELMHPSDAPTTVVGLEQDGNGFRERTPGLLQNEPSSVRIDADESYRRRIAMYTGHAYDRPPRSRSAGSRATESEAREQSDATAGASSSDGATPSSGSRGRTAAVLAGAAALLVVGFGVVRLRRAD